MAKALLNTQGIDLCIIAQGQDRDFSRHDCQGIRQWLVPVASSLGPKGLPTKKILHDIVNAVNEFVPDLIQIWGTESFWGLLTARRLIDFPAILTVQGNVSAITEVYLGGLSFFELLRCIGVREVLKGLTPWQAKEAFKKKSKYEREIIKGHRYIETQSPWSTAQVLALNPSAKIIHTKRALRSEFINCAPWHSSEEPIIFCSSAYSAPFKGLHVAIRALVILRRRMPNISIRIAGLHQRKGLRKEGYIRWLNKLINHLGLQDAVKWLGDISADQIVKELQSASVALIPSYVESYCLAMAEAMVVGTPIVSAFTGGTSYLAKDNHSCLFFPIGDVRMCAYQIRRLLGNKQLAMRLSLNAREDAATFSDIELISNLQINNYYKVLSK